MNILRGLEKSELCIGAGTHASVTVVDQAVSKLVRNHPAVRLQIKIDNWEILLPLLRSCELDIAVIVVEGITDQPNLHITRLSRQQAYFAMRSGHPLLTSKLAPTLQSMLQFPMVMTSRLPIVLPR